MEQANESAKSLTVRLNRMDNRIDKGPPGLWKVTEQVTTMNYNENTRINNMVEKSSV